MGGIFSFVPLTYAMMLRGMQQAVGSQGSSRERACMRQ